MLARINEYEADRCALQLAGAEICAISLLKIELLGGFASQTFWSNLRQQIEYQAEPPDNVYTQLLAALNQPSTLQDSRKFLEQALVRKTNNIDTHPCLTQRLKILGYNSVPEHLISQIVTPQHSAAAVLLGETVQEFISQLDRAWKLQVEPSWQENYTQAQEVLQEIETLEQKESQQPLNLEDTWKLACLSLNLSNKDRAVLRLRQVLSMTSNCTDAHYQLGQILLGQGDLAGVKHIEEALSQNVSLTGNSLQLLYQFFWERGEVEIAKQYRDRLDCFQDKLIQVKREKSHLSHGDKFSSHRLEASEIDEIQRQLSNYPQVREAYLVEKVVIHFPEQPFLVLGVVRKYNQLKYESEDTTDFLTQMLKKQLSVPGDWDVVVVSDRNTKLMKKMRQVKQSLIYQHS